MLTFLLAIFPILNVYAQPNVEWSETYGDTNREYGLSVQQTSDGGYIISGSKYYLGSSKEDVYLVKTNPDGDVDWWSTYGGTDIDVCRSVQQTSSGGYIIAGYTRSFGAGGYDVYLVKTNSNGGLLWEETYGGTDGDAGLSVQQTSDGGYITAGHTESFGEGSFDVYLIKSVPPIEDISEMVDAFLADGSIDNKGVARSLHALLDNAQMMMDKGNLKAAENLLNAFIHHVEALSNKKIEAEDAETLVGKAQAVIDTL